MPEKNCTELYEHPLLIVISGPSGVGKDSVIRRLREKDPSLAFVVTAASRGVLGR